VKNLFGNMLKNSRITMLKKTLRLFAKGLNVNAGNLSKIETGKRLPRYENLAWFSTNYGVPRAELHNAYLSDLAEKMNENP